MIEVLPSLGEITRFSCSRRPLSQKAQSKLSKLQKELTLKLLRPWKPVARLKPRYLKRKRLWKFSLKRQNVVVQSLVLDNVIIIKSTLISYKIIFVRCQNTCYLFQTDLVSVNGSFYQLVQSSIYLLLIVVAVHAYPTQNLGWSNVCLVDFEHCGIRFK